MAKRLKDSAAALGRTNATFCSVTFGAGGSDRAATQNTVLELNEQLDLEVAPHLAAIGTTAADAAILLATYRGAGIRRVVAIRGDRNPDLRPHESGPATEGDFQFGADLVRWLRETQGEDLQIYVGAYPECHPESPSLIDDLNRFREKALAGASAAITQYFYTADAYLKFVDDATKLGVDIPIIAGIMPIHDFGQVANFSARCGAEIPRWLSTRMAGYDDPESQRALAGEVVTKLCETLLEQGAPGLHFYTLNRAEPTQHILNSLNLA